MITQLQAVNSLLATVGEQPVDTLSAGVPEAALALSVLKETSREVQMHEWTFNRETKVKLQADSQGFIYVPENVLRIDPVDRQFDYTQRGTRLYDKKEHTFQFKPGLVVEVDLQVELEFDLLPAPAQNYIQARANRIFQQRALGSGTIDNFTQEQENRAYRLLQDYDFDAGDFNVFDNPQFDYLWRQG